MLIRHALELEAHLLLVDGDLRSYPPSNVSAFLDNRPLDRVGLTLPLWCRPRGQANSTNFLASPLLFAGFGARVRQPLAGQMLLGRRLLEAVKVEELPDGYGIDVAITMSALDLDCTVGQVVIPFPHHLGGNESLRIMVDVARAVLTRLAGGDLPHRPDVSWRPGYWDEFTVPPPSSRSLAGPIEEVARSDERGQWQALLDATPEVVRDAWCEELATAVRRARKGEPVQDLVTELGLPFLVHAEYRRRMETDVAAQERYVEALGSQLAENLAGALS
jgi:hypothetical protein